MSKEDRTYNRQDLVCRGLRDKWDLEDVAEQKEVEENEGYSEG